MQEKERHRTILKSTSLLGGAAVVTMLIGMVKTKFVAVLLGPSGVGLMGIYTALLAPFITLTVMGMDSSGVRRIAEANAQAGTENISTVVQAVKRTVLFTGLIGALGAVVLSPWLSRITFKSDAHTIPIAILSVTVLIGNIIVGQNCLLQGLRKIRSLAIIRISGAIGGLALGVPCFYLFGIKGIVPALLILAVIRLFASWWFARKVKINKVVLSRTEYFSEKKKLLYFGIPIMGTALLGNFSAYINRIIIIDQFGLDAVGMWGAAFAISGILVGFVLNAMGTDYYPRLTALVNKSGQMRTEVNAQTEVALLLAFPALLATILFAPLAVNILYSGRFEEAIPILRWSVFGIFGRVVSWPLGFIMLAQGRGKLFFLVELGVNIMHVFLIYVCSRVWGLPGCGIAFLLLYCFYTFLVVVISQKISKIHWSSFNIRLILVIALVLSSSGFLHILVRNSWMYYSVSGVIVGIGSIIAANYLLIRTGLTFQLLRKKIIGF